MQPDYLHPAQLCTSSRAEYERQRAAALQVMRSPNYPAVMAGIAAKAKVWPRNKPTGEGHHEQNKQ